MYPVRARARAVAAQGARPPALRAGRASSRGEGSAHRCSRRGACCRATLPRRCPSSAPRSIPALGAPRATLAADDPRVQWLGPRRACVDPAGDQARAPADRPVAHGRRRERRRRGRHRRHRGRREPHLGQRRDARRRLSGLFRRRAMPRGLAALLIARATTTVRSLQSLEHGCARARRAASRRTAERAALLRGDRARSRRSRRTRMTAFDPRRSVLAMNAPDRDAARLTSFSHGGGCGCKIAPGGAAADHRQGRPGAAAEGAAGRHRDRRRRRGLPDQRAPGDRRDDRLLHADRRRSVRLRRDRGDQRDLRRLRDGRHAAVRARARRHAGQPAAGRHDPQACSKAARRSARRPASRSPAATRSIRSSRSTAWSPSASSIRSNLKRNAGARPGDQLVLGKPIGVGVYSAALKKDKLSADELRGDDREHDEAQYARHRARQARRRACADRRHGLRAARPPARDLPRLAASGARIDWSRIPLHPGVARARARRASSPARPGATGRATAATSTLDPRHAARRSVRCSPIRRRRAGCSSPARTAVAEVLAIFRNEGFAQAAVIGEITAGPARVVVR